jgi:hypothetical protein
MRIYVLISDLVGNVPSKSNSGWVPHTSQLRVRLGLCGLDVPQVFLSALGVSALRALAFADLRHFSPFPLHQTCIIMHVPLKTSFQHAL